MTSWFENLKSIVNRYEPPDDPHALPRAAAALLLEMSVTDEGGDQVEMAIVHEAMGKAFGISPEEREDLLHEAHDARRQAVSTYDLTKDLRAGLDADQRAELVEWLWEVAFADAQLDMHEEHLVRRVADLLHVPHSEFIRRKLLVKERVEQRRSG